jgi:hypothetical protein
MKFCKRCGAPSNAIKGAAEIDAVEARLDNESTGLFWLTFLGLALMVGGIVALKKLDLSEWIIFGFLALSAIAFGINFALSISQIRRFRRSLKELQGHRPSVPFDTNELSPENERLSLEAAPSVTENTTRTLEASSSDRSPEIRQGIPE